MTNSNGLRQWWLYDRIYWHIDSKPKPPYFEDHEPIHVIEYSALESLQAELAEMSVKLQRTVNAAQSALLETTAWMRIPEHKREAKISEAMSNVKYCAEHDLRHVDESQRFQELKSKTEKLVEALTKIDSVTTDLQPNSGHMYLGDINKIHNVAREALKEYYK